jgi:hypothetical protein
MCSEFIVRLFSLLLDLTEHALQVEIALVLALCVMILSFMPLSLIFKRLLAKMRSVN